MGFSTSLAVAQNANATFSLQDATGLQAGTYKIYVTGLGSAASGAPLVLQADGSWAAPPTGPGTLTIPCYEYTSSPRQINHIQLSAAQQGFSVRAYYFIVTDFAKFPSCNPSPPLVGLFNNPLGFTYTYPPAGAFGGFTYPPPSTVVNQTFPAWTFSEIGASQTAATNDLSQVDFFAFPMNMQASVTAASPPNPTQVGNPVGAGNPGEAVNHASIRDAYMQYANGLAQAAGAACSGPTPPAACEWPKLMLDIPPSPPQSLIPQYVLQNPQTFLTANPTSPLGQLFDGTIAAMWATGAPSIAINSGGIFGAIPQDTFTSSIVTMTYPSVPASTTMVNAMKFVGVNSGFIAYVFDPKGVETGCNGGNIPPAPHSYCSNPTSAGYQVFAGAGTLAQPDPGNFAVLSVTPNALKPGTTSADYGNLVARLGLLISGAMNRGVARVNCGQATYLCWQDEKYWYPTTTSATFLDITQSLYSFWMHTNSIKGIPAFVQPPGALAHASGVPAGGSRKMGMAYGFAADENPTPQWVPPQPEVPSKFDNTVAFPSTGTITFGPWVTALTPTLLVANVPSNGGTVSSSPAGIACNPTCSQAYATGTPVTLTAAPAAGFVFANWSGACSGASTTCSVTVNATTTVVANYTQVAPTSYPLSVVVTGPGSVSSGPPGINCPALACSVAFPANASVTLTVAPSPGATFAGWSGACAGTAVTCTVTMSQARSVGASFTSTSQVTLTVQGGAGGGVTSVPAGINCGTTCIAGYALGTAVSLVATPSAGYQFTGWGGACSGTSVCDLTMDSNKSVTAAFSVVPPGQFSLTVSDFGNGSIVSTPAGIACGTTCAATFPAGTLVTLSAAPGSGYAFAGWGGACTGLAACVVVMDQLQAVSATFVPNAVPPGALQVPTLSEWGLFLLTLLIALVAAHRMRGRRS